MDTHDAAGPGEVTQWLRKARAGDAEALDRLMPLVYNDLRREAMLQLRGESRQVTLQPTALVHEAYLRLIENQRIQWNDRGHFFAVAAQIMRRILVDHARARLAGKRGGGATHITVADAEGAADGQPSALDVLMLDETLRRLASRDARQAQVVEMRVFAGMTVEETAAILELSPRTIKSDWQMARAWLAREMATLPDRTSSR